MRAIASVEGAPFRLVFAGGTCMARAHRLIDRMSEDVDFKIERLDPTPVSNNQLRGQLGSLRDRISAALQDAGFHLDKADIRSRDDNRYTIYQLPYAEAIQAGELRPTIQIELNCTMLRRPSVELPVASFVSEAFQKPTEIASMPCVDTTETAAEKFVSLTRRTAMEIAGAARAADPALVRHIYDLHRLELCIDRAQAIDLAREIAASDGREFENQYPAYAADPAGETRKAIAFLQSDPEIQARYRRFQALMVYGEQVDFSTAMKTVAAMASDAWPDSHKER